MLARRSRFFVTLPTNWRSISTTRMGSSAYLPICTLDNAGRFGEVRSLPKSISPGFVELIHGSRLVSRHMQRLLAVVGVVIMFASCGSSPGDPTPSARDISAVYVDVNARGRIDQTVTFRNRANVAVIPEVHYRALDAQGNAVPGIEVTTAFGSDRSLLVIPPSGYFDVLRFAGDRVDEVVDVDIEITSVAPVNGYDLDQVVEPEALAADGAPMTKFDPFSQVALTNPSKGDVYFRVVCLLYETANSGNAQQARDVSVVVEATRVPAGERIVVPVTEAFATRTAELGYGCDSLKLQPTPPPPA